MNEGDLVLCTVEEVSNTITHVRLPDGSDGTVISSEIAPGRIKHMRHYVVPNKTIVCKILEISGGRIHLSLRRVTSKEKRDVMQQFKQDHALTAAFNQLIPSAKTVLEKIREDFSSVSEFMHQARENSKILEEYIPKECHEAIRKIFEKRRKGHELKAKISLSCKKEDGIKMIKQVLEPTSKKASISYLSAGKFLLTLIVEDFKQGKKELQEIIEELQERAKNNCCEISIAEER